jgi:pyruvate/oxaloacetate carboxyltransferase
LKPGLEQARKDAGSLARSEEDVLSYALFPEIAKDYFLSRDSKGERHQALGNKI